jgi:hypothetical protein
MNTLTELFFIFNYSFSWCLTPSIFGHGIGYEVLPPVMLGSKQVALEVTPSQYEDPDNSDREIQFSLFDTETGISLRDVTFHIIATKGDILLFDETFATSNGVFIFVLEGNESDEISFSQENQASFFESMVGLKKR